MPFSPLICRGNLKVNAADVSAQATSFTFSGTRDQIDIPATFGVKKSFAAGNDQYQVQIDYLQSPGDATALTTVFWDALASTTGTFTVAGSFWPSAVSASNPLFTATALVAGAKMGGATQTVGIDSVTCNLTGPPVKSIA